jgi:5-methylcytosine-specific restriction endonuclease McrBC regulatory subunit McrC
MTETIIRYRTQGISHKQHWSSDELTDDIPENRIIKSALTRVIGFLIRRNEPASKKAVTVLRQVYRQFDNVREALPDSRLDEEKVASYIKALPYHYRNYSQLIWLSFLIVTQRGLLIDSVGNVNFDTFVVNLADIFEDYVRNIISDYFYLKNDGYSVKDGNKAQVPLFQDNNTYQVKPDVYIVKNREALAVIDAKYKPSIKPADRYEVISFCEALQVKRAIVVSPRLDNNRSEFLGRTPSGIEFWHLRISLGSNDIAGEENDFLKGIDDLISPQENP